MQYCYVTFSISRSCNVYIYSFGTILLALICRLSDFGPLTLFMFSDIPMYSNLLSFTLFWILKNLNVIIFLKLFISYLKSLVKSSIFRSNSLSRSMLVVFWCVLDSSRCQSFMNVCFNCIICAFLGSVWVELWNELSCIAFDSIRP